MPIKQSKSWAKADWPAEPKLDAPIYIDALNGQDGKIWRPALDANGGLRVQIDVWSAPFFDDNLYVWWSPIGLPIWTPLWQENFPTPVTTPTIDILIPQTVLKHGRYQLRYAVRNGTVGDYTDFSKESEADIDYYPPYQESPSGPVRPPIAGHPSVIPTPATIITQTIIDTTPEFEFVIPPDPRWEAGATISYWWTSDNPADNGPPISTVPFLEPGMSIDVPNTFFSNPDVKDGILYFVYQLNDSAGNKSMLSRTEGRILKRSSGLTLAPLIIREVTDDDLIDIPELKAHVKVAIPFYPYQHQDQALVHWGSQTQGPITLNGTFDFEVTLDDQKILDEYGTSSVRVTTEATYEIIRNGGSDFPATATEIDVNLWAPGDPPDIPGQPNDKLNLLQIRGPASAPTLNYLNKDDFDDAGPIQALIELWMTPSPRMNDIIEVWLESTSILVGTYTLTSEAPGADIVINLDKTELARLGNGDHPMFWTVREPGSNNHNTSLPTSVEFDDAIEFVMAQAEFRHTVTLTVPPYVLANCLSIRGGPPAPWAERYLEVMIPPNDDFFAPNTDVLIEFRGSNGWSGTLPAIPGTDGSQIITLDPTTAKNGFIFKYGPYVPFLKPLTGEKDPYMSCWLRYSVDVGGTWARSVPAVVAIRMFTSNNDCDNSSVP